jgi:hypothetical protein
MENRYLYPVPQGIWAISRLVEGRWIALIQDRPLFEERDAEAILRALGVEHTVEMLDLYFPHIEEKDRCPTLELLELCNVLDPTNPLARKDGGECGV